jgi:hypothetical protein
MIENFNLFFKKGNPLNVSDVFKRVDILFYSSSCRSLAKDGSSNLIGFVISVAGHTRRMLSS